MSPSNLAVICVLSGLIIAVAVIFIAPFGGGLPDFAIAAAILVTEIITALVLYRIMTGKDTRRR
jgi:Na+-translocating ferredoxin:NAD+ oxidoreductase RnfD subunit